MTTQKLLKLPQCRAIIPMKDLMDSKTRLQVLLPDMLCNGLVLMMLERVVSAVVQADVCQCLVVGGDSAVKRIATSAGAEWTHDPAENLNDTVRLAMKDAYNDGMDAALYLPGDIPLLTPDDVIEILFVGRALTRPVGVPAATGGGTNALLIPAGLEMDIELGPRSYARHRAAAKRAGTTIRTLNLPTVATDVDEYMQYQDLKWGLPNFAPLLLDWMEWLYYFRRFAPPPIPPRGETDDSRTGSADWR